ncbi:MAG: ACT domain-containing protein [Candidatus Acidiferrum sp.]
MATFSTHLLKLSLLPGNFAICKFASGGSFPVDYLHSSFFSITKTDTELSVVCEESAVPADVPAERARRVLRVEGPLDFSLTGILAALAVPLAAAGVSIFALSTYDTDYLLIAGSDLDRAISALEQAGHTISRRGNE